MPTEPAVTRKQLVRIALAVLGGLAVGLAFLGALVVLNTGGGLSGCTAATAAGFTIPLLTGLLVGAITWVLLAEDSTSPPSSSGRVAHCEGCGRPVPAEWRLCPFCGAVESDDVLPNFPASPEESAR